MKHLKRIFESTEELDTDYIEMCFVDFIDQGCEIDIDTDEDGRKYICLLPNLPDIEYNGESWVNNNKSETINDVLKSSKQLYDFYKEINTCIKKVKIEYPNIEIEFSLETELLDDDTEFGAYLHLTFMLPKNV